MLTIEIESLVKPGDGLIDPRVFQNHDVYDLEMDRVFSRSWLFICHESQLEKTGDYLTTYMGTNAVIAAKQRDKSVKVFLNACRHRGLRVCYTDCGNARSFTCRYHGWAYSLNGDLAGMPHAEVFGDEIDKAKLGLIEVERVESVFGLIFATFSEDVPPLTEYLGDLMYYLEASFGRREGGVEIIGGVSKCRIHANWKLGAEQFSTDMYHLYTAHKSPYAALGSKDTGTDSNLQDSVKGGQFSSAYGHGFGWWESEIEDSADIDIMPPVLAEYFRDTRAEVSERLGKSRAAMETHATLFPNFSWLYSGTPVIKVWQPKGPTEMEVHSYAYVDAAAPEEVKAAQKKFMIFTFGNAGVFEQDDSDIWSMIQKNLEGNVIRRHSLRNNMGLGQPEVHGNGRLAGVISEMGSRGWFHRWSQLMCSDDYPEPALLHEHTPVAGE